ncbi:hypothetical protein [Halochromatium salexigens]|uniref:hypothetical protein n=1 Tax=Halochromatium salexigens TaxID=49447 RepID=UPI0019146058|nr:hypothetical protein [Halochromatium salexigens]
MASGDDAHSGSNAEGGLWPSADYQAQVERLRAAVGEPIYLAELRETDIQLGVHLSDRAYLLLGVIDFPRPDPARGLAPHLILLDDGRGVNLGRIARISRQPFQPTDDQLLYLDRAADQTLLFADRRLSQRFIAERTQAVLGQVLGRSAAAAQSQLESAPAAAPSAAGAEEPSSSSDDEWHH